MSGPAAGEGWQETGPSKMLLSPSQQHQGHFPACESHQKQVLLVGKGDFAAVTSSCGHFAPGDATGRKCLRLSELESVSQKTMGADLGWRQLFFLRTATNQHIPASFPNFCLPWSTVTNGAGFLLRLTMP